ncbi:MAG TPA: hypothetical protein VNV42_15445 [Solirubrobacteraceae bacterium]|jgi:hypothetical protein|nr:hypothetical protein [Solirubrobacteraceae bacterium]
MTTVVLGASYLSASLLTMLVPIATVIAMVAWGVFLIRRHERHRVHVDARNRPPAGTDAPQGSRSPQGG